MKLLEWFAALLGTFFCMSLENITEILYYRLTGTVTLYLRGLAHFSKKFPIIWQFCGCSQFFFVPESCYVQK